jgi:hypothetical protein
MECIKSFKKGVVFEGWGTSLSWFANGISTDSITREHLCKILFEKDNKDGLQLNIIRYNIGGCDNTETNLRSGGNIQGFYGISKSKWESVDVNQRYFLKRGKELGVTIFEAFSNSPPKALTVSGDVQGNKYRCKNNLKSDKIDEFGNYLVQVTKYLIENDDIPFTSISPMNEPSSPGWIIGCGQEACYYNFFGIRGKLLKSVKNEIKKNKLKPNPESCKYVMVSGCEENNMFQALLGIIFQPFSYRYIDRFNVHRYEIGDALKINTFNIENHSLLKRCINWIITKVYKKGMWMSEWGCTFPKGVISYQDFQNVIHFADSVMNDLLNLKCSAWIYWQVIENLSGNGWGSLQFPFKNGKIEDIEFGAQFRAFQHFTHFIKEKDTILEIPKSKNKDIKWVGSMNEKCINIIILSISVLDIKVNLISKNEKYIMTTCREGTLNYTNFSNEILIKGFSLTSIRIKK